MTKMIAAKGFTYGTRRLQAGDLFQVNSRHDARALVALGRAQYETAIGSAEDSAMTRPKAVLNADASATKKARTSRQAKKA